MFVPSSIPNFYVRDPIRVSSLDDDNEDENPPPPSHLPPDGSIKHEPKPTLPLLRWVRKT